MNLNKPKEMEKQKISIKLISMRARSKKEIYRMLQLETNVYLPLIQQDNSKYITDIIAGKKKVCFAFFDFTIFDEWSTQNHPSSAFNRIENERHPRICQKRNRYRSIHTCFQESRQGTRSWMDLQHRQAIWYLICHSEYSDTHRV